MWPMDSWVQAPQAHVLDVEHMQPSSVSQAHWSIWQVAPQMHGSQEQPSRRGQAHVSEVLQAQPLRSQTSHSQAPHAQSSWQAHCVRLQLCALGATAASISLRMIVFSVVFILVFSLFCFLLAVFNWC
jgi:hypothetical protein